MSTEQQPMRASDRERDEVAQRIQEATAEGRLTLEESGERLSGVFASRYRHELAALVADLPASSPAVPERTGSPARPARPSMQRPSGARRWGDPGLLIHTLIVVLLSAAMLGHWVGSNQGHHPWPVFPLVWLWVSVAIHARRRNDRADRQSRP
ncbi:protein of unknown function [Actinopolymorpha cephalotaxi]|uniref:DUF1707 domain-containing protein n=1 Tax=Actinopolymorpha cephalotaxi TaxID=504797 RepID=A0A1I2NCY2_9ACTN|nr:DUF1707 domain-containing protein [Actinopolymorpha cephalotaxi]NYH85591.1 hypothetical protein [Actinopolymorpha cephalotaxi]SFG01398.1 protein of unknown function [Actinopolymorpha cephalotaxi]